MTTTHPMQRTFSELRRSRLDDPQTSRDSARRAHSLAGAHRAAILASLRQCGEPVVFASVHRQDGERATIAMDPSLEVYHRIVDPDGSQAFWYEDRAPKGAMRQTLARHRCAWVTPCP